MNVNKLKTKWRKIHQDPHIATKFHYKITKVFVYFIMFIIGIMFIRLIYNQFKEFSSYSLLVGGFMIIIFIYMLYNIYSKVLLPQQKILDHYENNPIPMGHKHIDVKNEVDEILKIFDSEENKK